MFLHLSLQSSFLVLGIHNEAILKEKENEICIFMQQQGMDRVQISGHPAVHLN